MKTPVYRFYDVNTELDTIRRNKTTLPLIETFYGNKILFEFLFYDDKVNLVDLTSYNITVNIIDNKKNILKTLSTSDGNIEVLNNDGYFRLNEKEYSEEIVKAGDYWYFITFTDKDTNEIEKVFKGVILFRECYNDGASV